MYAAYRNRTDSALGEAIEQAPAKCPNCGTPKTAWRWTFNWLGSPSGQCPGCEYTNHRTIIKGQ